METAQIEKVIRPPESNTDGRVFKKAILNRDVLFAPQTWLLFKFVRSEYILSPQWIAGYFFCFFVYVLLFHYFCWLHAKPIWKLWDTEGLPSPMKLYLLYLHGFRQPLRRKISSKLASVNFLKILLWFLRRICFFSSVFAFSSSHPHHLYWSPVVQGWTSLSLQGSQLVLQPTWVEGNFKYSKFQTLSKPILRTSLLFLRHFSLYSCESLFLAQHHKDAQECSAR